MTPFSLCVLGPFLEGELGCSGNKPRHSLAGYRTSCVSLDCGRIWYSGCFRCFSRVQTSACTAGSQLVFCGDCWHFWWVSSMSLLDDLRRMPVQSFFPCTLKNHVMCHHSSHDLGRWCFRHSLPQMFLKQWYSTYPTLVPEIVLVWTCYLLISVLYTWVSVN